MASRDWILVVSGLAVALAIAGAFSPFASTSPDGLEKVAADKGFLEKGEGDPVWQKVPAPDYQAPGIEHQGIATALAGLAGTLLVFGVVFTLGKMMAARRSETDAP